MPRARWFWLGAKRAVQAAVYIGGVASFASCGQADAEPAETPSGGAAGTGGESGIETEWPWGVAGASGAAGSGVEDAGVEEEWEEPPEPDASAPDASAPDATAPDAAAPDPCAGQKNGKYCGGAIGGTGGVLYTCSGGVTASKKSCSEGCFKASAEHACSAKCCVKRPPGTTSPAGAWNSCPFTSSISNRDHKAIDYGSARHTPIPASMDGTIHYISNDGDPNCKVDTVACKSSGNTIVLRAACGDPKNSKNALFVRYHHIQNVAKGIKVGTKVARGTVIATVGDSGYAFGTHIHFQVASHPKGKVPLGKLPDFFTCGFVKDPGKYLCSSLLP